MRQTYKYQAVNARNEVVRGVFGGSQEEFEHYIHRNALTVFDVSSTQRSRKKGALNDHDFIEFIEELHYLVNAGVDLQQAFKLLGRASAKESIYQLTVQMADALKNGMQLSSAFLKASEAQRYSIDRIGLSFLVTAEESGNLRIGVTKMLDHLRFQRKIKNDVKGALAYPAFLLIMSLVVTGIIFFFILPRFSAIFTQEEFTQLPALSQIVLTMGEYLNTYQLEAAVSILLVPLVGYLAFSRLSVDWLSFLHRLPILSSVIVEFQLSVLYGTMGSMLEAGLELDKTLKKMQRMHLLRELIELLHFAHTELKNGVYVSDTFTTSQIIPSGDVALISIAEQSASMATAFTSLSSRHQEQFNLRVRQMIALIEPIVIVLLGLFVAVIVIAILLAVLSMTDIVG